MQSCAIKWKTVVTVAVLMAVTFMLAAPVAVGADDAMEESAFISIRRYDGINPANKDEIENITREGFVPILRESDGFIGYYVVFAAEDVVVAINLFESREQSLASNELAREFVVESLAPLVPNPPQIVEGSVDIGFVEMLDGMVENAISSLHASVRIYDEFDTDDRDDFVATVEDGFLPLMRETDGFFGYYLMNDGGGNLAAISIFDSEDSALASNEKARDFVAESLTAFLPNAPSVTSGRVGIAVLADANAGANLIDDMMKDEGVFVSIRVYDDVDPMDQDELVRIIAEGFLPIMRESDGFVGYYLLPADDKLAAISMFDSAVQASSSTEAARAFVAESLAPLLPNAPMIIEGMVDLSTQMFIKVSDPADLITPMYGALRIYSNYDMSRLDEANELVETILLPAQIDAVGLFSYLSMNDGVDNVVGLSVLFSEEDASAANEIAAAFVAEHLADWLPDDPLRINGRMGVVALKAIVEGMNLAEWTLDG